jgi:hypothetical protein
MAIDWTAIGSLAGEMGDDALKTIKPYLPALGREGKDVYEGFLKHLLDNDWPAINQLMYEKMTTDERRELEDQVYKAAVEATQANFRRKELMKEIAMKLLLSTLVKIL